MIGFVPSGFEIKAVFDIDPHLIGNFHGGVRDPLPRVNSVQYLEENPTDIGIIATPKDASQEYVRPLLSRGA
jgi:redox-sensing transcriptional repressor